MQNSFDLGKGFKAEGRERLKALPCTALMVVCKKQFLKEKEC